MKCLRLLVFTLVALLTLMPTIVLADTYVLYENYTTGPNNSAELYLANYFAQTFTVGTVPHTINTVRLNLSSEGATMGNLYVSIRATNASGYPNGLDLSTGAYSGAYLVSSTTAGLMYEITMTELKLTANTTYAIVCYGTGTTNILNIHWYGNWTASSYTGGSYFQSTTGGINWTANTSRDFMFEVYGKATNTINDVKVFEDYQETGDWLITVMNNIEGDCNNFNYAWRMQLYNTVTSAVIAETDIDQCGMRPDYILLSANTTATLVWGGNYSIKIYGNYGVYPNATRQIATSDWIGPDPYKLEQWVISQAKIMATEDYTTYIETVPEYNEVLNVAGGSIFDIGIPLLSYYHPDIFQMSIKHIPLGYVPTNGSTSYADDLYDDWDLALGPDVSGALTTAAPYFGFTGVDGGRMIGALLTIMGFIALAVVEKTIAFMIIIGGVLIGVFPMATIVMLVFILAVVLIRSLFWSST